MSEKREAAGPPPGPEAPRAEERARLVQAL
jgi:hypothetical protein